MAAVGPPSLFLVPAGTWVPVYSFEGGSKSLLRKKQKKREQYIYTAHK
jgi:hypothetical protein